ncbi:hypothetical protein MMC26_002345 [Xylographa opegraphella]|nr:hypothetical protein [Xylographa opegraphella]
MSSVERIENYKPWGLHPVHLGDTFDPRYRLVACKDNQSFTSTSPAYLVEPTPLPSHIAFSTLFRIVLIDLGAVSPTTLANNGRQITPLGLRFPQVILYQPLDEKADFWTLGLTIHRLVTRRRRWSVQV